MAPFRNKGWLFYSEMVALCPDSAGATGSHSYLSNKEETLDQGLDQVQPPYSAESSLIPTGWEGSTTSGNPLDCDINIDQLFQLGHDLTSSSISTQLSTVHDTLATLGHVPLQHITPPPSTSTQPLSSGSERPSFAPTFDALAPSSSCTSLVSSGGISKGKARAQTSATLTKASSLSSSAIVSQQQNKVSQSQTLLANAAAMTGIAGAINCATDCMNEIREMLHTNPLALSVAIPSTATPPVPHNFLPTPPNASPEAADGHLASRASQILVGDATIDPTICGQLVVAFLTDSGGVKGSIYPWL